MTFDCSEVFFVLGKPFTGRVLVVFVVVALFAFAGCSPAPPAEEVESGARKVVEFEGGEITEGEVQEQIEQFAAQGGAGEIPAEDISPGSPQYEAALQQVMPQLVGLEIARAYADENNITVSQEDVDEEIELIKDQLVEQARQAGQQDIGRDQAFQQALEQAGISEQQLRQDIRRTLPVQEVQEEVVGDVQPSEDEIRAFYEENEVQFTTPEQRCARHILFNQDQRQRAEEVKDRLQDGGDFGELAREFSQDPQSAEQGGDLGCQGRGSFVPAFEDAMFNAEEGEIVGPVETDFGYHLIEVTETRPEETAPLEEVQPQIREQLAQQEQATEFERWLEQQEEERNIQYLEGYNPDELAPGGGEGGQPDAQPQGQPEGGGGQQEGQPEQ